MDGGTARGQAGIGADAVARAEAALQTLSHQFAAWMTEELSRLEAAHARLGTEGPRADVLAELQTCAHDLKGLGETCGHPLAGRALTDQSPPTPSNNWVRA